MEDDANEGAVAGARAYEELHVPALFRRWVDPVLNGADVTAGQSVLDLACGTGILARGALGRVGARGTVIGVDPDGAMLAVAAELEPSVEWRRGSAESIPVADASLDAVVSQFGMTFFPDKVGAAREMRRVLRPGGRISVAVWDTLEENPAYAREAALLDEMAGKDAGDAIRLPFAFGDPERLRSVFADAGFEDVEVESRAGTARFPDIRTLVGAELHGWLPVLGIHLGEDTIEATLAAAERELADLVVDGAVVFPTAAKIVTAGKP